MKEINLHDLLWIAFISILVRFLVFMETRALKSLFGWPVDQQGHVLPSTVMADMRPLQRRSLWILQMNTRVVNFASLSTINFILSLASPDRWSNIRRTSCMEWRASPEGRERACLLLMIVIIWEWRVSSKLLPIMSSRFWLLARSKKRQAGLQGGRQIVQVLCAVGFQGPLQQL